MDFYIMKERERANSSLRGLSHRVLVFSARVTNSTGTERVKAISTLARMSDEAHVSGPLSAILRADGSIRSLCNQVKRDIETQLGKLLQGLEEEAQLMMAFQSLRGRFPLLARQAQEKALRLKGIKKKSEGEEQVPRQTV